MNSALAKKERKDGIHKKPTKWGAPERFDCKPTLWRHGGHYVPILRNLIRPRQRCLMLRMLPTELVLELKDWLDPPSLLAFSLACLTTYQLCFPRTEDIKKDVGACAELHKDPELMAAFLLLLEKDRPHTFFCFPCVRLHCWGEHHSRGNGLYCGGCRPHMVTDSCYSDAVYNRNWPGTISLSCARLALKHHLYGPKHGIPVTKLRRGREDEPGLYCTIRRSAETRALIVDDRLLLRTTCIYKSKPNEAYLVYEYLWSHTMGLCRHHEWGLSDSGALQLGRGMVLRQVRCKRRWELRKIPEPQLFRFEGLEGLRSCRRCATDYTSEGVWDDKAETWTLTLTIYTQVGTARLDEDWTPTVSSSPIIVSRPEDYDPGFVRYLWSKGAKDEPLLPPRGNWY